MVFESIDSPEKAWLLGWIATDGNVYYGNWRTQISLQDGDSERHVCRMFEQIAGGNSIGSVWKLNSKKECQNLAKLGILPHKSLSIGRIEVPERFIWHFVRGVFEGDGGITLRSGRNTPHVMFVSGGRRFIEWIGSIIGVPVYPDHGGRYFHCVVGGKVKLAELYQRMYDKSGDFVLARKKEKYEVGMRNFKSLEQLAERSRRNGRCYHGK
jgi:hypothetical protein